MRAFALLYLFIVLTKVLGDPKVHRQPFCRGPTPYFKYVLGTYRDRHCCADWKCYGKTFKIRHEETDHFFVAYTDSNDTEWIEGNFKRLILIL